MPERRLGNRLNVPVLGLGTWRRFDLPVEREGHARQVIEAALNLGVRLFDTAEVYGRAQGVLARALGGRRVGALVASKLWADSRGEAETQLRGQERLFGSVDLEQIHNLIGWRTLLPWLDEQRQRGRIRLVGATLWRDGAFGGGNRAELVQAMRTGQLDVVQVPLNPRERWAERDVLPLADELGIAVLAMRPFGEGELLHQAHASELRRLGFASPAAALLRWTLSDTRVTAAIPATREPAHLRANRDAATQPPLDIELRERLSDLFR